jgi:eukaryotic-like serine/threonine-protein kinase
MLADPREDEDLESPLARARRVHRACERYETDWRKGVQPRLEHFVDTVCPEDRLALFSELLPLEIELRREHGDHPCSTEYLARFPDLENVIVATFRDPETAAVDPHATAAWNSQTLGADSPDEVAPAQPVLPGEERVGDYLLLEEIARGGMGIVYKAQHLGLKRLVALKMILSGSLATPAERARFRREAELAANLDHPNIVPIYEVRDQDGMLFFSMKLIDGGNLAQHLPTYARNPRGTARLVVTLAQALHYAHGKGFIHCDLKPSNVLIDRDGHPQITDFGLARRTAENSSLTATGDILGTPSYMAPEQAAGQRQSIGPATDVYGLGAILYELLTGQPPFRTPTSMETVLQVLYRDPVVPHEVVAGLPRELETICLKCLEKSPEDRYPNAQELANDLERYLQGDVVEATGVFQKLRRWTRREPEVVSRIGGLSVVALLTEFNHQFAAEKANYWVHYGVQGTLLLWALSALLFQFLWRKGWRSDRVRLLWSSADLICLTLALKLLNRVETTLLVGYPLMIAASGLWFRVNMVWFTTGLAVACYLVLYFEAAFDWSQAFPTWTFDDLQYPNIYVACLILTGFVVARQVKRTLALGQYYENRQGEGD